MVDQKFAVSVHVMLSLAAAKAQGEGLVTSEYLASSVRTNPAVIRRLVAKLSQAELIRSYRGKAGGLELARAADSISLADIYSSISERTLIQSSDKSPKRVCPISCSMGKIMGDVIDGVEKNSIAYLSRIPLSELLKTVEPKSK